MTGGGGGEEEGCDDGERKWKKEVGRKSPNGNGKK